MKHAKLALAIIIVAAIISGTLAFKGSRGEDINLYIATVWDGKTYCSVPTIRENAALPETPAPGPTFTTRASISPNTLAAPCPVITLKIRLNS